MDPNTSGGPRGLAGEEFPLRRFFAALAAVLMLTLSGCALFFPAADDDPSEPSSSSPAVDYTAEYSGGWCYQRLSARLKSGYAEVYAALRNGFGRDETVVISDSSLGSEKDYLGVRVELSQPLHTREEAEQLYTAVTWDNPQFFYLGNTYSYEGYRSGKVDNYNIFCLVYTMNAQERTEASRQLNDVVSDMLNNLPAVAADDDFLTEKALHGQLLDRCSYETETATGDDPISRYPSAFTAYGALVEGRAVCEGYARAMQLLLHRAGIEATLVSGTDEKQVAHMWNLVTIDGRNYHLDPTWNDSGDRPTHSYFNLTTEEILRTHTIDSDNIGVDTCTATEANYYLRLGMQMETSSRDKIASAIADQIRRGETMIELRFTPSTFPTARLFVNKSDLLKEKVNEALRSDGLEMWDYQDYAINEAYYTITIYRDGGQ